MADPPAFTARAYAVTNSSFDIMFVGTVVSVFDSFQMALRSSLDNPVFFSHLEAHNAGINPPTSSPASSDMPHTPSPDIVVDTFTVNLGRGFGAATVAAATGDAAAAAVAKSLKAAATMLEGRCAGVGAPTLDVDARRVGTGNGDFSVG